MQKDGHDPETNHDLAFGPSGKLEVMMQRSRERSACPELNDATGRITERAPA
jgi:hypothetical protein